MTDSWHGPEIAALIHRKALAAAEAGARHLIRASNRTIPFDKGDDLERSGKVSTGDTPPAAAVSYNTDYAVIQHERQDYTHDPGRRSKFLEQAMNEERGEIARIVRKALEI